MVFGRADLGKGDFFFFLATPGGKQGLSSPSQGWNLCSLQWKHSLNHWMTREVPVEQIFILILLYPEDTLPLPSSPSGTWWYKGGGASGSAASGFQGKVCLGFLASSCF